MERMNRSLELVLAQEQPLARPLVLALALPQVRPLWDTCRSCIYVRRNEATTVMMDEILTCCMACSYNLVSLVLGSSRKNLRVIVLTFHSHPLVQGTTCTEHKSHIRAQEQPRAQLLVLALAPPQARPLLGTFRSWIYVRRGPD